MATLTPELACSVSQTSITVDAGLGSARARVRTQVDAGPDAPVLRPMLLGTGPTWARIALLAEGALLLAGDRLRVAVEVGPGVHLRIVEPTGVVAYAMHGRRASWELDLHQHPGSTVVWEGQPFVAAAHAVVDRRTRVTLAAGARLLLRETLVLGRSGEPAGRIENRAEITCADVPLLVEELTLATTTQVPGILGSARVLDTVLALGHEGLAHDDRLDLDAGGHLYRWMGGQVHLTTHGTTWQRLVEAQSATEV